jgi:hypothetical protein
MNETQRTRRGHDFLPPADELAKVPPLYGTEHIEAEGKKSWCTTSPRHSRAGPVLAAQEVRGHQGGAAMNVTLTTEQLARVQDEGTVVVLTGTDDETGDLVTFGTERHVFIVACGGLLSGEGQVTFKVESWQVLGRQGYDPVSRIRGAPPAHRLAGRRATWAA